jgi:hypothetical protein
MKTSPPKQSSAGWGIRQFQLDFGFLTRLTQFLTRAG